MSHDPSDCFEHARVSSCCGARVMLGDICSDCREHCDSEPIDASERQFEKRANREFSPEQLGIIERMERDAREP